MDLTIKELSPEIFRSLSFLAKEKNKSVEEYVREMIEVKILSQQSFDEILAPVRQDFKKSGMTEAELDDLFEKAREKVYQEKLKNGK